MARCVRRCQHNYMTLRQRNKTAEKKNKKKKKYVCCLSATENTLNFISLAEVITELPTQPSGSHQHLKKILFWPLIHMETHNMITEE